MKKVLFPKKVKYNKKISFACVWFLYMLAVVRYLIQTVGTKKTIVVDGQNLSADIISRELWLGSFILLVVGIVLVFLLLRRKYAKRPEKIFLILYIFLALGYGIALPAYKAPDEYAHFLRAYEVSQGTLITPSYTSGDTVVAGQNYPANLIPQEYSQNLNDGLMSLHLVKESWNVDIYDGGERFYSYIGSALYAPLSYLPQAIGIFTASLFTSKAMLLLYAARTANAILSGVIGYYAIKNMPFGKNLAIAVMLMPMNIHQAISCAPDIMVNTLALGLISLVLYLRETVTKITGKHLILMYTLCILIALNKIVYVPLCLLLFLIPRNKFMDNRQYFKHVIGIGCCIIVCSLGWLAIASKYMGYTFQPNVNSAEQVIYILTSPLKYLLTILNTIFERGYTYLLTMFGSGLAWMDISINPIYIIIYIITMICAMVLDDSEKHLSTFEIFLLGGVGLIIIVLIFTSLYLQWTPVGNTFVEGVQGRYFIPIMLPLLLIIQNVIGTVKNNQGKMIFVYISELTVNMVAILTIFNACI